MNRGIPTPVLGCGANLSNQRRTIKKGSRLATATPIEDSDVFSPTDTRRPTGSAPYRLPTDLVIGTQLSDYENAEIRKLLFVLDRNCSRLMKSHMDGLLPDRTPSLPEINSHFPKGCAQRHQRIDKLFARKSERCSRLEQSGLLTHPGLRQLS